MQFMHGIALVKGTVFYSWSAQSSIRYTNSDGVLIISSESFIFVGNSSSAINQAALNYGLAGHWARDDCGGNDSNVSIFHRQ